MQENPLRSRSEGVPNAFGERLSGALRARLLDNKKSIGDQWAGNVIATYPEDAAAFMNRSTDRFDNPVGLTIAPALAELLRGIIEGDSLEDVTGPLDDVVRVRAVQQFTAAEAIGFVFDLKGLLRDAVDGASEKDTAVLAARIDAVALLAFNIYSGCRDQLLQIRRKELNNRTCRIEERQNRRKGGSD